jgi:hypothetical protein
VVRRRQAGLGLRCACITVMTFARRVDHCARLSCAALLIAAGGAYGLRIIGTAPLMKAGANMRLIAKALRDSGAKLPDEDRVCHCQLGPAMRGYHPHHQIRERRRNRHAALFENRRRAPCRPALPHRATSFADGAAGPRAKMPRPRASPDRSRPSDTRPHPRLTGARRPPFCPTDIALALPAPHESHHATPRPAHPCLHH